MPFFNKIFHSRNIPNVSSVIESHIHHIHIHTSLTYRLSIRCQHSHYTNSFNQVKMAHRGGNSRRNQDIDTTITSVQCDGLVSYKEYICET